MILPRTVDERTRDADLTLEEIRGVIPQECFKPNSMRSWWTFVRVWGCAAVCLLLISQVSLTASAALLWQIPLLVALWILYGSVLVGAFLIGHDCGHGSFSSRGWINDVVGWICMTPLANSFLAWKLTHQRHHAFTQLRGHDVDWASHLVTREEFESSRLPFMVRAGYALPCGVFLWIAWNTVRRGFMLHKMFASGPLARQWSRLLWSNVAMSLALIGIYGELWYWFGFWGMLKYHGIPATVAMVTSWVIITIQHANRDSVWYEQAGWTPVRGQLVSTFDVRFPRWLEYVWCYGNIHIPHHVAPPIPWYNLKKAGRAIQEAYPDYYQEQRFRISHLKWLWRTPFLERDADKSYYMLEGSRAASVAC